METKICSKCGRELPIDCFEKGRRQCKGCRRAYKKNEYNTKKAQYNRYAINRQKRCEDWINSLKTPCVFCGESDPVCIDWHHIDPSQKSFAISFIKGKAKERTLEEMKKCICVCASCHRKLHAGHLSLSQIGIEVPIVTE